MFEGGRLPTAWDHSRVRPGLGHLAIEKEIGATASPLAHDSSGSPWGLITNFPDDQTSSPLLCCAHVRACPGLFGLPCRFAMGAQGAEIDNQVCDAHEDALLHVAKPRELVCEKTDKDVER